MKNCRNCGHAEWSRTETGRKRYGNYAECKAVRLIDKSLLPKSFTTHWPRTGFLERGYSVASNNNVEVNCGTWIEEAKK